MFNVPISENNSKKLSEKAKDNNFPFVLLFNSNKKRKNISKFKKIEIKNTIKKAFFLI
jgi:hypothetical protein